MMLQLLGRESDSRMFALCNPISIDRGGISPFIGAALSDPIPQMPGGVSKALNERDNCQDRYQRGFHPKYHAFH